MISHMAAFNAGVIILYCGGQLLPWFYYIFVIAIAGVFYRKAFFSLLLCFVIGAGYFSISADRHMQNQLPEVWVGKTITLKGYACSLPQQRDRYFRIDFCVLDVDVGSQEVIGKDGFLQTGRVSKVRLTGAYPEPDWSKGLFSIDAKLKQARSSLNFSGFEYERYLFSQRIVALGSISQFEELSDVRIQKELGFNYQLTQYRLALLQHLHKLNSALEHEGILNALIIGDRSKISEADALALRETGTQHLMAISGLHVGIIMGLLFCILPKSKWAAAVISLVGLAYVLMVGFEPSAQRAWVMGVIACFCALGAWRKYIWRSYFLAMMLVIVFDPLSVMRVGFWYSFVAVALLLLMISFKLVYPGLKGLLLVQGFLMLVLYPLNGQFFAPQGWGHALANIVAIPIVSLIILPGALLSFLLSVIDVSSASEAYGALNEILHILMTYLGSIPKQGHLLPAMSGFGQCLFAVTILAFITLYRLPLMSCLLIVPLLLFIAVGAERMSNESEVVVFDVGQGLAILIRHNGVVWLYDLGPAFGQYSSFNGVVSPYLSSYLGVQRIDGLIISHGDHDHASGALDAIEQYAPDTVVSGEVDRLNIALAESCYRGMRWEDKGLLIEVLFPELGYVPDSANNHSCVVRVILHNKVFLLMGDLEGEAELDFLRSEANKLGADVLVAGHHGSKNASSYALLKRVLPDWLVFSAGYQNRFGHPHSDVIERAHHLGIRSLNTGSVGALRFLVAEDNIQMDYARNEQRSFWLSGPR